MTRRCPHCDAELMQSHGESLSNFAKRVHCSRQCARTANLLRAAERKASGRKSIGQSSAWTFSTRRRCAFRGGCGDAALHNNLLCSVHWAKGLNALNKLTSYRHYVSDHKARERVNNAPWVRGC